MKSMTKARAGSVLLRGLLAGGATRGPAIDEPLAAPHLLHHGGTRTTNSVTSSPGLTVRREDVTSKWPRHKTTDGLPQRQGNGSGEGESSLGRDPSPASHENRTF